MTGHYTAWVTTDPTCLNRDDDADVVVLRDEFNDVTDQWVSTGDLLFHQGYTISRDIPAEDLLATVQETLETAGWNVVTGQWQPVATGYITDVTRA